MIRLVLIGGHAMNLRLGTFALTIERYPVNCGFHISKWSWQGQSSWHHGSAFLGRFKIIW